jgi:hypothetical protein
MSENKRDYEVGAASRGCTADSRKASPANPHGPRQKKLPVLLVEAFNDKVVVTIDGERREITKREAISLR